MCIVCFFIIRWNWKQKIQSVGPIVDCCNHSSLFPHWALNCLSLNRQQQLVFNENAFTVWLCDQSPAQHKAWLPNSWFQPNSINIPLSCKGDVFFPDIPDCSVGSCPDLLQVPVPLRNLPHSSVYLLPVESRPGPHSHSSTDSTRLRSGCGCAQLRSCEEIKLIF